MSSPLRDLMRVIDETCGAYGCSNYDASHGGKHLKIVLFRGDEHRTVVASKTPSCSFAHRKVQRDIEHALAALGYERIIKL